LDWAIEGQRDEDGYKHEAKYGATNEIFGSDSVSSSYHVLVDVFKFKFVGFIKESTNLYIQ
jgi:hypothetical protein